MSPAVQGDYISDLPAVANAATELPGGLWEVEVLAGPVAGAYVNKRLTTEQLADYLGAGLGPNDSKSLEKQFRFFRKADRDADSSGGACFETDLNWNKCCTFTVAKIEFYRESDTEPYRKQNLVCVYDDAPTDPSHKAWVDGSFSGLRNPSKFVPEGSVAAQLANIPVLDPTKTNYPANTVVQYTIGGQVYLYQAVAAGGPFPVPTATDGSGTANWKSIGKPTGGNGSNLPTRDPYDVDTAKRIEVVDANVPAYPETDAAYYFKEFIDEVRGSGKPAYYKCMPSAPATAGATVFKWFRLDIL